MLVGRIVCILATATSFSVAFSVDRFNHHGSRVSLLRLQTAANSLVVISPPGGVDEVSAVKAAELGSSVRGFVVSQTATKDVVLSQETLDNIAAAGGAVELAGAEAPTCSKCRVIDRLAGHQMGPLSYSEPMVLGARPVYAKRPADTSVDIVWQKLVEYESVTVGTMKIQVTANGLIALRGPGDASKGFGDISKKPLSGEDLLVRCLADAASQAVEKGLATKLKTERKLIPEPVKEAAVAVTSARTFEKEPQDDAGPRQAGARRSAERTRGTRPNTDKRE